MGTSDSAVSDSSAEDAVTVNKNDEEGYRRTAHRMNHDPWYQLGMLLSVGLNCGFILGYSNLILKPLGWIGGIVGMAVLAVFSCYGNCLLAKLHIIEGRRFIRYRDLMGFVLGRKMYYVTYIMQFVNFYLGNVGLLLLSGRALKGLTNQRFGILIVIILLFERISLLHSALVLCLLQEIYEEYNESSTMTLQEFIVISGGLYFAFAFLVPNVSAMRVWSGISAFFTAIYVVIVIKLSISNGLSDVKNYKINGTKSNKIFNTLNAIAAIIFANNTGMIPELQGTLKQPAIKNMEKVLYFQFSVGLSFYYGMAILGYWAYGSSVSEYLLRNSRGPKWEKVLANATVFVQTVISQQIFCAPIHETLDTRFSRLDEKTFSTHNVLIRFILRSSFFTTTTFVAAMMPFLGDFVNLSGSLCVTPLTFIFPSIMYLKVKGKRISLAEKIWHWLNIIIFSLITVATVVSSFHSVVYNAKTYHVFANT